MKWSFVSICKDPYRFKGEQTIDYKSALSRLISSCMRFAEATPFENYILNIAFQLLCAKCLRPQTQKCFSGVTRLLEPCKVAIARRTHFKLIQLSILF